MSTQYCKQCQTESTWTEFDDGICDGCWYMNQKPTNQAEAHDLAIDWANWQADKDLSYLDVTKFAMFFAGIAEDFDLVEEFRENGII